MASLLLDRYRRWFDYEKDIHAKVLASLNAVPAERRSEAAFTKALTLLAHIVAARQIWLFRFGVAKEAPSEFFPTGVGLTDLATRVDEIQDAWSTYLNR